jgi:predicted nucleic acid-binding protein
MPDSSGTVFIDANVLLYLASRDERKIVKVQSILAQGGTISVQILNEIANVSRRKMRMGWDETIAFVEQFRLLLKVVPLTEPIHGNGLKLAQRYQLSVYDGQVVAAALDCGCSVLLSEDMHHGLKVEGRLEIRNPFV